MEEIRSTLIFNGHKLTDYGVYVSGDKTFDAPKKEITKVSIPGRSGDLISFNGRYSNVNLTYDAILIKDYEKNAAALRSILMSPEGYCRLEDTYHKDEYRMAHFTGPLNFDSVFLEAGQTTLTFDCKPQRWLKDGENEIEIADSTTPSRTRYYGHTQSDTQEYYENIFEISNPTLFEARPLYHIHGNSKVIIQMESSEVDSDIRYTIEADFTGTPVTNPQDYDHYIDCETMTAYRTHYVNSTRTDKIRENSCVAFLDPSDELLDQIPSILPGTSNIYVLRTKVTPVTPIVSVIPRWYIL